MDLVFIRGPGGAGKSTLGDLLAKEIPGALHIDIDKYKVAAPVELGFEGRRVVGRREATSVLQNALATGKSPIFLSECFIDDYLLNLKREGEKQGYSLISFYIDSPLKTCLARNRGRDNPLSDKHIQERYVLCMPYSTDIVISNVHSLPEVVAELQKNINGYRGKS